MRCSFLILFHFYRTIYISKTAENCKHHQSLKTAQAGGRQTALEWGSDAHDLSHDSLADHLPGCAQVTPPLVGPQDRHL